MPCLAEYVDGLWYRAKIVSIKEFNPLTVLVQFVDYGSTEKLTINRSKKNLVELVFLGFLAIRKILPLLKGKKAKAVYVIGFF